FLLSLQELSQSLEWLALDRVPKFAVPSVLTRGNVHPVYYPPLGDDQTYRAFDSVVAFHHNC
ncbi:MAG TPA: hypothetical protein V6D26_04940, partial [Stenomitos sp.]